MSEQRERVLSDFSGGIFEAVSPFDFSERQASAIKGFVFDNETVLRSQWAVQRIGGLTDVVHIAAIGDIAEDYLVALRGDGSLWWARVPFRTASDAVTRDFAGWQQITQARNVRTDAMVTLSNDTSRKFLCEVPVHVSETTMRTGLLVNSLQGSSHPLVIFEPYGTNELVALRYDREFPTVSGDTVGTDIMPRANVGAMWGDVLCLADAKWYRNANAKAKGETVPLGGELAGGNVNAKRYKAGFWTSYVDASGVPDPTAFHPDNSWNFGFVSPEARIMGMQEVKAGMLVFTGPTHFGNDGVVLLRGRPYDYEAESVRAGIGIRVDDQHKPRHTTAFWPEVGAVTFIEQTGQVWHTDGQRADRLDRGAMSGVTHAHYNDHTAALRGHLFVFRQGRALCLNLVTTGTDGGDLGYGCWTELVMPHGGVRVTSSAAVEDSLYFVQGGEIFRFQMGETRKRGHIDGVPVTVSVSSAPMVSGAKASRGRWARVGVRAHSPTNAGTLVSVTSHAGSPLVVPPVPALTTPLNRDLSGQGHAVVARGHGRSNTAAVTATFTGDVVLESLSLTDLGVSPQRTSGVGSPIGGVS